jgi:hypothetical protein
LAGIANLERHNGVHYGGNPSPVYVYVKWFCSQDELPNEVQERLRKDPATGESYKLCDNKKKTGWKAATTRSFPGTIVDNVYTLWCSYFFGEEKSQPTLTSLEACAKEGAGYDEIRKKIGGRKAVRAKTMVHETFHWHWVWYPQCDVPHDIYEPEKIVSNSDYGGEEGFQFNLRAAEA